MKVVIIVPTYNERDNIGALIPRLQDIFVDLRHEMHVLVVDDNSPDGTGDVIAGLMQKYPNVHLISGPKQGLGAAYIRGIRHAIDSLDADAVFEMDADFSHAPEDVPKLLEPLEQGADFVIGSRYVHGGSIPNEWHWSRKLISNYGNKVARYLAGLRPVRDCTAGFRAIRVSLLKRIDLSALRVRGYAFQVALLHEAVVQGANIKEVPVHFVDRVKGASKLGLSDVVEFIINAWWIRFRNSKTFLRFCVVGGSGVVVNLGCFSALLATGMDRYVASPIAVEVSIVSNFLLNNYWTFGHRDTNDSTGIKGLKFNIVSLLTLGVSYTTFIVLSLAFPQTPPQVHQLAGIIPASLMNYFMNSYWTFRDKTAKRPASGLMREVDCTGEHGIRNEEA